jgi:4a-hydroxytetrahydrobiopterin dehydratase
MQTPNEGSDNQPGAAEPRHPATRLKAERVQEKLAALQHWALEENGAAITRSFRFRSPAAPLALSTLIGVLAQESGHYPAVTVVNRTLFCRVTSPDGGGLTEQDFELARRISLLP